jgi:hypothetical protein
MIIHSILVPDLVLRLSVGDVFWMQPSSAVSRHHKIKDNLHTGVPGVKLMACCDRCSLCTYVCINLFEKIINSV